MLSSLMTRYRQHWGPGRGRGGSSGLAPRDLGAQLRGTLLLPRLRPWKPQHRTDARWPRRVYRNPRVLRNQEATLSLVGLGASDSSTSSFIPFRFSSSRAFCFYSGILCGREGKGYEERLSSHPIIKEHEIRYNILERKFVKAVFFGVSTCAS